MKIRSAVSTAARLKIGGMICSTALLGLLIAGSAHGQSAMPRMQGMDHSNMPGMGGESKGAKPNTVEPAPAPRPAANEGDGNMQGMDHGNMPGMGGMPKATAKPPPSQPSDLPPKSAQRKPGAPDLQPSRQYRRNPDGSIPIPGEGMAMADHDIFYMVLFDQLEYVKARDGRGAAWDAQAWVGRDFDKFWLKTEGERLEGKTSGRLEGLWSHAFAAFWDWQVGVRHDFGRSPSRQWLAVGVQGIAPYWFDVEAAAYVGPEGRTAARLKTDYTIRLSQVTFLTPEFEANAYGKSDPARGTGSGLSDVSLGLRLRYEIRREFAPYIGIAWNRKLGNTADFARRAGEPVNERQLVAGVRIWF